MNVRAVPRTVAVALVAVGLSFDAGGSALASASGRPSATSPPTITGTPSVGQTLTAAPGNWSGNQPQSYDYQWRRCNATGGDCINIAGAKTATYTLGSADAGSTLRIRVTATNSLGSASSVSVPSAVVSSGSAPPPTTTSTTTTTSAPATGCPVGPGPVAVSMLSLPTRLLINQVSSSPQIVTPNVTALTLRVQIGDTCGQLVSGALVYVTATPYNQFSIPPEATTGADGWATLTMQRLSGFPVSSKQALLALFVRARKSGENILAGISARQLVSLRVNLHG